MTDQSNQSADESSIFSFRGTIAWGRFWIAVFSALTILVISTIVYNAVKPDSLRLATDAAASGQRMFFGLVYLIIATLAWWIIAASVVKIIRGVRRK